MLLAIPNFSEGRDRARLDAIGAALVAGGGVSLLDIHSDPDHNRSVFTLWQRSAASGHGGAGVAGGVSGAPLADALTAGARRAIDLLDIATYRGAHPHVGILDVAPIVYMEDAERGEACAQALVLADRLGSELEIPVFIYGELSGGLVTRAQIRRGGPQVLQARIDAGELAPDFGPARLHPRAGAALVAARGPLVAFNVELAPPANLETARAIAALIREGGAEGLPAVRAIGLTLEHRDGVAQVSTNLEDYRRTNATAVLAAIARHARPLRAEVVGLPPRAAFDGFPEELPVLHRRHLEDAVAAAAATGADAAAWSD